MESPVDSALGPWAQFGMSGLLAGVLVTLVAYLLRRLVDGMLTQNQQLMTNQIAKLDEIKTMLSQNVDAVKDLHREAVELLKDVREDLNRATMPATSREDRLRVR